MLKRVCNWKSLHGKWRPESLWRILGSRDGGWGGGEEEGCKGKSGILDFLMGVLNSEH